ncbi:MAG: hypothetical protein AMQ74_01794 [Candidatus Methanofastidiosum methylothiophilum]|uniref:YprB ribonuclease H-like domain-containing protein n=1 Tax=Candidatus Methanofastidiosum methylothiophilum TaxID=1705564 RepID=A0A150INZ3_9EURY|nr:MAG: hypothetical protein AMQ74_01794 [Candidatus Methanofastidiosum methylthiophilus]
MVAPVHRLKKDEIIWLANHKCRHGHTFLEHYNCFLTENPDKMKIGYLDIESSSLVADFGFCITWYILDNTGKFYGRTVTRKELKNDYPDSNLVKEFVDTLDQFDLIYTYNGVRFDWPFMRTRCVMQNINFPVYGSLKQKDIYYTIKSKFRIHRKSLEVACEMILGHSNKTHWMGKYWIGAVQGKQEALDYIDDHCRKDVTDLKELTETVLEYAYPVNRSI